MATSTARSTRFHGRSDSEINQTIVRAVEGSERRYLIIQERAVEYRFYLHQHPYVQQLVQRLLREGTSGLQAADTDYVPNNASQPASIVVALAASRPFTIAPASKVALLASVRATSGGAPLALASHMELETVGGTSATVAERLRATLVDSMTHTPTKGAVFALGGPTAAFVLADTKAALPAATQLRLHDGTQVTIPAGTEVLLPASTRLVIPNGSQVELVDSKPLPVLFADFFDAAYKPDPTLVQRPYPVDDLDFTARGAYSAYNWELFFHVPFTIAIHLSKNQRFAEAQRWFHYVFDPTDDSEGPTPERFWKVRPFQTTDVKKMEEVLVNLATGADEALRDETVNSINAWMNAPFRPHLIARYRQQAYMYKTVMAYLDNLIAWGDSLFRQDTGEAIDEAMMLYVLAANILGPRPQPVPKKGTLRPQTYANLRNDLREFGTVLRDVEADLPFDLMPYSAGDMGESSRLATLRSMGQAPYFCVPRNDKLLSYWDTVADRLFKIRNSLSFQGTFRQLALFEPPIDPAMLARAAASGLDVGSIVNGINQPLPLVRFQLLVQKATEIVQEVKSLGNNLLAAMEKEDGEALAILRAKHERVVMEMVEQVRYGQMQEAIKSKEGLQQTLALAVQRYTFYERQLGKTPEEIQEALPTLDELDTASMERMSFAMNEDQIALRDTPIDIAADLGHFGGKILSSYEAAELSKLQEARNWQITASSLDLASGLAGLIPQFDAKGQPMGCGVSVGFGGQQVHTFLSSLAAGARVVADQISFDASNNARIGGYARRELDWAFQSNLAAGEITQIFKQLRAAQIREAVAEWELRNHRQQMKHAQEIERFLNEEGSEQNGKRTNKALYTWMKREVKGLYSQCFQFAFDIARRAERALQHELGNPDLTYLQFGYLAGKEGLLAGERLYLDIKRMEVAYLDLNQREYELTRHVSLLQVDPLALLKLRTTGHCTVRLPESLFDMDGPGHYFRRIRSVAVSIPCMTGPYASVNCTLTLLKSSIRKTQVLSAGAYAREDAEDDRFNDYFGSLQSIVTSSAQNDSGLFEANLHDERYLPFEGSGVISEWQLELPADPSQGDPRQFDYGTISDVILHLRYTARQGGGLLRKGAVDELKERIAEAQAAGSVRLFSVRHEFPSEWARFQSHTPGADQRFELAVSLREEHYPFWSQGRLKSVPRFDIFARSNRQPVPASLDVFDKAGTNDGTARKETLTRDAAMGGLLAGHLTGGATGIALPAEPVGDIKLFFDERTVSDLWIAVTWSAGEGGP